MKRQLKNIVVRILASQVIALRKKHQFKVIGVVGGIGKTSTKSAVAQVLENSLRVQYQDGNYNDIVSVPLVFFGENMPSLMNPIAWMGVFARNFKKIHGKYPYEVVVLELGSDYPGDIAKFSSYISLDIAILTSIVPEHMENFADLQAVADEELAVTKFSKHLIYNNDLVDKKYVQNIEIDKSSYSLANQESDYYISNMFNSAKGFEGDIKNAGEIRLHFGYEAVSEVQLYSVLAAVVVAENFGVKNVKTIEGINNIRPVSGRLRRLRGIGGSLIIDDTYNSSPEAVKAALNMLYKLEYANKIAILGNMNELGDMSAESHMQIGELCDPNQLSAVVTIGADANKHLASAAEAKGCLVKRCITPYEAGEFVQAKIQAGTVVLAKGSQNRVFAEEAVKMLLADPEDANKLVRQSKHWLSVKERNFKKLLNHG